MTDSSSRSPQTESPVKDFARRIQDLASSPDFRANSEGQQLVAALVWQTIFGYVQFGRRSKMITTFWCVFSFLVWCLVGYGLIVVAAFAARAIAAPVHWVCYGVAAASLVVAIFIRIRATSSWISFAPGHPISRLRLGRLESVFHPRRLRATIGLIGLLLGLELGVLQGASEHLGLADREELGDQTLIALDNLCYGALLDVFELYGLSLTDPVEHTPVSATVFLVFRTTSDVLIVFLLFVVFQRRSMRSLLDRFPDETANREALIAWLYRSLIDKAAWIRSFQDEILFLTVALKYLEGERETVSQIASDWPHLRIRGDVKQLFVSDSGENLFDAE